MVGEGNKISDIMLKLWLHLINEIKIAVFSTKRYDFTSSLNLREIFVMQVFDGFNVFHYALLNDLNKSHHLICFWTVKHTGTTIIKLK